MHIQQAVKIVQAVSHLQWVQTAKRLVGWLKAHCESESSCTCPSRPGSPEGTRHQHALSALPGIAVHCMEM